MNLATFLGCELSCLVTLENLLYGKLYKSYSLISYTFYSFLVKEFVYMGAIMSAITNGLD